MAVSVALSFKPAAPHRTSASRLAVALLSASATALFVIVASRFAYSLNSDRLDRRPSKRLAAPSTFRHPSAELAPPPPAQRRQHPAPANRPPASPVRPSAENAPPPPAAARWPSRTPVGPPPPLPPPAGPREAGAAAALLPPSLAALYPRSRLLPSEEALRAAAVSSPRVLTTYVRPSLIHPERLDLFLFTAALTRRRLRAGFCLVRGRLLPVDSQHHDVVTCIIAPRALRAVHVDARLQRTVSVVLRVADPAALPTSDLVPTPLQPGDLARLPPPFAPDLHAVRSSETAPPFDDFSPADAASHPRYALCHVLIVCPAAENVRDWADHHRRLGVDHVFVFDNGAKIDLTDVFRARQDVEVITWPWRMSQVQAYALAMIAGRRRCRHVFISDLDEWLMPGLGDAPFENRRRPLHAEVARGEAAGFHNVQFPSLPMLNSGYIEKPRGHWPELYVHRRVNQRLLGPKSVCATDHDWRGWIVHECGLKRGGTKLSIYAVPREVIMGRPRRGMFPDSRDDAALLIHFYTRSWEEWVEKHDLGSPSLLERTANTRHRGKFRLDRPNMAIVNAYKTDTVMRYTHFRDVWRRVRAEAPGRVNEVVLVTTAPNGTLIRTFINIAHLNRQ